MPVIVNVAAVLVREISPLPVLVALKLPTIFAKFRIVPPTELVVNNPVVLIGAVWLIEPDEVKVSAPVEVSPLVVVVAPSPMASVVSEPIANKLLSV